MRRTASTGEGPPGKSRAVRKPPSSRSAVMANWNSASEGIARLLLRCQPVQDVLRLGGFGLQQVQRGQTGTPLNQGRAGAEDGHGHFIKPPNIGRDLRSRIVDPDVAAIVEALHEM